MSDKELYQKQLQAQLDEWQADLVQLKAMAAEAHGSEHPEVKQKIREFERRIAAARRRAAVMMSGRLWLSKRKSAISRPMPTRPISV